MARFTQKNMSNSVIGYTNGKECSSGGRSALRDEPNNGCEGDYLFQSVFFFLQHKQNTNLINNKISGKEKYKNINLIKVTCETKFVVYCIQTDLQISLS